MNDMQLAWLAGLLEGEGCFYFRTTPWIMLQMTDEDVVQKAALLFKRKCSRCSKPLPSGKYVYHTHVTGTDALGVMESLLPFMGIRRSEKIKEVMALSAARPGVAFGERAGCSVISDADAGVIKEAYLNRKKHSDTGWKIAAKYGISQAAVWYIANRRKFPQVQHA